MPFDPAKKRCRINWSTVNWDQRDADLARLLGCSRQAVRVARLKVGLPRLKVPKTPQVRPTPQKPGDRGYWNQYLADLAGLPVAAVAEKHGATISAVYSARRKHGVTKAFPLKGSSRNAHEAATR